jgi:hypothetical protein
VARILYVAKLAVDRETGLPILGVRDQAGTIIARGNPAVTPVITEDQAGTLIIPGSTLNITGEGFVPSFWVDETDMPVSWWDGAIEIPLETTEGIALRMEEIGADAAAAQAAAQAAQAAAEEAANLVGAPADETIAALVANVTTDTGAAVEAKVSPIRPDGGVRAVGKGELVVNVKDFGAVGDGAADDTVAIQAAIDSLIVGSAVTSATDAPITIPEPNGGTVYFPPGTWKVGLLRHPDMVELRGAGEGRTRILVTTGIRYETRFETAYYTVWAGGIRDLRITGATGAETLVGPGVVTDATKNRLEHTLTEWRFRNVAFENGAIGLDLRGWNNRIENCWFRDLNIGLNLDTSKKRTDPNTLVANPGDNDFDRVTFNDCTVSVKAHHAKGNTFRNVAAYRADNVHYWFGEGCNGNVIHGGRTEDAPNYLIRFDGAELVKHGGTVYKALTIHTADSSNEPGVGASWTTAWETTTEWDTERTWVSGRQYLDVSAIGNKLDVVDLYIGPTSRTGRNGATITRSANYRAVLLDGDQHSRIRDCWSGAYTAELVRITDRSTAAVLLDNMSVRAEWAGTGTPSHSEEYQTFGTATRTRDYDTEVTKLRKVTLKGETADFYWTYATTSPRAYQWRSAANVAMEARETSGVVHLPKQTFITTLNTAATSTVVSVTNVSTTDVALLTPRSAAAATAMAAGNIYAVPEANDKIRIYHPTGLAAGCTFNVVLL